MSYVKVIRNDVVYYFRENVFDMFIVERKNVHWIMQYADFAIHRPTNTFLKCRFLIEDLVDSYANI